MGGSATDKLAEFITGISFADLPREVVGKAKLRLLDALGCGLGGSTTRLAATAVDALSRDSAGDARVLGRSARVGIGTSAFLNALSINALDYDDADPSGHPSSTVAGSLLGLSGREEASGRDLLLSYVIGVEVSSRIGQAIAPSAERFDDVWGLGTHQVFGAVAAAARYRQLNKMQTLNAMGIAGASAPVPSGQKWGWDTRPLTWVKDAVAFPAQAGVVSATLAGAGFAGCRDILDGPRGFWRMAASDRCDFELMTRGLGTEFFLASGSYKTWPCCWFIHPALTAIRAILAANRLSHEDIARIDVWSLTDLSRNFAVVRPREMVDAQFSVPYCAAMAVLGVPRGPDWFDAGRFTDAQVLSIGSRVRIHADREADDRFHHHNRKISARVRITTTSGAALEVFEPEPRGSPANPIGDEEIMEKFHRLATPVVGAEHAAKLEQFVLTLETRDRALDLCRLIAARPGL